MQSEKAEQKISYSYLPKHASSFRFALFAVLAMACYQIVLCFINTQGYPVSSTMLAGIEMVILFVVLFKVRSSLTLDKIGAAFGLLIYFMVLWAFRGEIDLFAPRCLMIIFLFYILGRNLKNTEEANRIVWMLSWIVLIFAFAEYFFTDAYLNIFNILNYNISRGLADNNASAYMTENLAVNGLRFTGRNLLPFLGDHRVSSIFLEPVSLGNYAIILTMWFLSLDVKEWRKNYGHLLVAAILVIASDSRFASMSIFLLFLVRFIPLFQRRLLLLCVPVFAVGFLILFTYFHFGNAAEDNLTGRLARSGETILTMDFLGLFGLNVPRNLGDMGISFSLENFGLFLVIFLWLVFALVKMKNARADRFRAMTVIYALSILMISGTSFYSSKTASILWLLMGSLTITLQSNGENKSLQHFVR